MEFAPRNVANSAEMIHAIIYNFAASLSCNIRHPILDNGAFSKPIFSTGEGTERMLTLQMLKYGRRNEKQKIVKMGKRMGRL